MFIEIRKQGKKKKYYLVHSYRVGDKIKRISRYLGSNLSEKGLEKLRKRAEEIILKQIKSQNPFEFELSQGEIKFYKNFEKNIKIEHFQVDWKKFTKDFTYNTNAIEGSTVKYPEVKALLDNQESPENPDELETICVANAVQYLKNLKEKKLSIELVKKLHCLCFNKTKHFAGELRNVEVVIRDESGYIVHQGAPSKDVLNLLNELVKWYNKHLRKNPTLLIAALLHNQFEEIHPFQDGNGRIGRLLLNFVLITNNYPPINIMLKDRQRYYWTLRIFDKTGNIKPTLRFLISQYKKQYG